VRKIIVFLLPVLLLITAGCGSKGDTESSPRRVVVKMLKAMEDNDRQKIAHYLDFKVLLQPGNRDYALQMDSIRTFRTLEDILDDLTEGGLTYERWMAMQRIVANDSIVPGGDTAFVEVSFISRETNTQYYNKWGLHKVNDIWKIYSFGVLKSEAGDD
jgi:hypothetical protein